MNEVTEKWETTGLLQELDDFMKVECAYKLDEAVIILHGMSDTIKELDTLYNQGFFTGTILPIIRRVFSEYPDKAVALDVQWVIDDYIDFLRKKVQLYKELNSYIAMDGEAEFVCLYCLGLQNKF